MDFNFLASNVDIIGCFREEKQYSNCRLCKFIHSFLACNFYDDVVSFYE